MKKNKINRDEIEALYEYSVKFYNKEISLKQAQFEFTNKFEHKDIKVSTINFYLYIYGYLVDGIKYTGIISEQATRFYLDKILETKGKNTLIKALNAQAQHIKYHNKANRNRRGQKKILEEYTSKLSKE